MLETNYGDNHHENNFAGDNPGRQPNGWASEAITQLSDYSKNAHKAIESNKISSGLELIFFGLSDKERNEILKKVGDSLEASVKADLPHLKERMKELGLSAKELDELDKKLDQKVASARPFEEAILKGDSQTLQKLMSQMDSKQLEEIRGVVQKHLDKQGLGVDVDLVDGKLVISLDNRDKAVAVSRDKVEMVGVNLDGSYNFNKQFRHADAAAALKSYGDSALYNFNHGNRIHW